MMIFFQKQQLNALPPLTLHESNNEGDKKLDKNIPPPPQLKKILVGAPAIDLNLVGV